MLRLLRISAVLLAACGDDDCCTEDMCAIAAQPAITEIVQTIYE